MTFDLKGAARDHDERAKRYAPIWSQPGMAECIQLLHRNPAIAPVIRQAIEVELSRLPGGGVSLDEPLFDAGGQWLQKEGA